jgi:hypothetical protein
VKVTLTFTFIVTNLRLLIYKYVNSVESSLIRSKASRRHRSRLRGGHRGGPRAADLEQRLQGLRTTRTVSTSGTRPIITYAGVARTHQGRLGADGVLMHQLLFPEGPRNVSGKMRMVQSLKRRRVRRTQRLKTLRDAFHVDLRVYGGLLSTYHRHRYGLLVVDDMRHLLICERQFSICYFIVLKRIGLMLYWLEKRKEFRHHRRGKTI